MTSTTRHFWAAYLDDLAYPSVSLAVVTSILSWFLWVVINGTYNLYLHPLSKFPGPKLAAFTIWWKIYVELIQKKDLVEMLFELHAVYGDVVRIAPNELHFAKPSVYHEIHSPRNRWSKDPVLYNAFAEFESSFTIPEYHRAKKRKDILQPLFSRKSIISMQHLIQDCMDQMCEGIAKQHGEGKSTNILLAFRCLAVDTITSFCFAKPANALAAPDFQAPIERAMTLSLPMVTFIKYFPAIKTFVAHCPPLLVSLLKPGLIGLVNMRKTLWEQVLEVTKHPETLESASHPIIYHALLNPVSGHEIPSFTSLRDEALLLVFAGTDTASNTLTLGTIHILSNPDIHKNVVRELLEAWPRLDDTPRYEALDSLPYLRAIVKESLRLVQGVVTPMTRVVPVEGAELGGRHIPGGTVVGISNSFVLLDGSIFPDPHSFRPERWLEPSSESLDHWLVTFCKGPRSCLGVNLGYCELFLGFANLFRRFELELDGVSAKSLRWKEAYLPHYEGPDLYVRAAPRSA
ncbi:hypothetical protein EW026_g808 [Hermanssonia centrifuga]|uniref:Cytochrome P450 n=1 Tax=Hermanssonia centrifuga TaxID=98765 RepID=A0A4S4KTY6_9APHY|nr:hypothetical protein EW026_g808 [Hermanssonia centrifuga]